MHGTVKAGHYELGNYSQAIIYLDKALEIEPYQTGAKYYADKAFEIDPESPALKRLTESPR